MVDVLAQHGHRGSAERCDVCLPLSPHAEGQNRSSREIDPQHSQAERIAAGRAQENGDVTAAAGELDGADGLGPEEEHGRFDQALPARDMSAANGHVEATEPPKTELSL